MPIYEYTCQKCKAHVEILQKITDKPLTKCRKCGGKLEKEWSQTSFQLKGSGWYVTDYARKDGGAKETTETKEEKPAAPAASAESGAPADTPKTKKKEKKEKPVTSSTPTSGD